MAALVVAVVEAVVAVVVGSVTVGGSWRGVELRGPRRCLLGRVVRRARTLTIAYSMSDVNTKTRQTIIDPDKVDRMNWRRGDELVWTDKQTDDHPDVDCLDVGDAR